jgi:hypothetical protein
VSSIDSKLQGTTGTRFISFNEAENHAIDANAYSGISSSSSPVLREYFGRSGEQRPGPQGYLVEIFPPHTRNDAHFHSTDQYQVFFPSKGTWYQRHDVESILLHYTDAYTTYGPFGTKDDAMSFYTLRPTASTLTAYMPGSRDKLPYRGRRNIHVELGSKLDRTLAAGETGIETLIEPEEDGLAAYLVLAGPSAVTTAPALLAASAGQYLVLVGGGLRQADQWFEGRSLGWSPPGDDPVRLETGPDTGFELLALQFPAATTKNHGA